MRSIIVIAHNIRSIHNVGAILRTCDGFGIDSVIFSGYTPYPMQEDDTRLPHISRKITAQIHKTALGAEQTISNAYVEDINKCLADMHAHGYRVVALEQADKSISLPDYHPTDKIALLLGEEVEGISPELLKHCDDIIEIPMYGRKESFNVSVATGIGLYHLRVAE